MQETLKKMVSEKLMPIAWHPKKDGGIFGAIALSYPPVFIDDSGAEFHAD